MDVLVGLDAGTSSTKAVTAGSDAVVRDAVSVGYPLLVPAPGCQWAPDPWVRSPGSSFQDRPPSVVLNSAASSTPA